MSPVEGRKIFDVQAKVLRQPDLVPKILAIHVLRGCDTVPAGYGIGKPTALKAAANYSLAKLGHTNSTVEEILTECRQRMWSFKTGNKPSSAPKLKTLPLTTEAFLMNIQRTHFQV